MGVKNARRSLSRFVSECRMPYLDNDILRKKKKKKKNKKRFQSVDCSDFVT